MSSLAMNRLWHEAVMIKKIIDDSILALNPIDRVSEILTAIVVLLAFLGSLSVATTGRQEMHAMLRRCLEGAMWPGESSMPVLYLMDCLAEKRTALVTLRAVRTASDSTKARQLIADSLPSVVASIVEPQELETLHQRLRHLPAPPEHVHLDSDDWRRAIGIFLLMFLSTLPMIAPFAFMQEICWLCEPPIGIAIVMLFVAGFLYGRLIGSHALRIGLALVAVGVALVAMTIALGG